MSASLLLVTLCAVLLATGHPWLGLELEPDQDGVRVIGVVKDGPADRAGLKPGAIVKNISSANGNAVAIDAEDIMIEPDDHALYSNYLAFFEKQAVIYQVLQQESITLRTTAGDFVLSPYASRPIYNLSFYFWFQLFCAYSIVVMGVLVWIYSRREMASRLYALATIGLLVAIVPSAIYTTRELALGGELFYWLSRTNQVGVMLFAWPGTALFWFYPRPVNRFPVLQVLAGLAVVFLLLNFLQVYESLDNAVRLPVVFWLTLDIAFGVIQWVKSKNDPVSRAQLKWFIVAWISGPIAYVSFNIFPLLLGFEPIITQKTAWVLFVFVYLGMALGLRRYRLFNLDRWILHAWFWLLCGAGIILFDALLVSNLNIAHEESIIISLALIGWVYFPLRQFLFDRFAKKNMSYNSRQLLPELLTLLLTRSRYEKPAVLWPRLLEQMYQPLHLEMVDNRTYKNSLIENDGQSVVVPELPGCAAVRLYHANKGARLFSPQDTRMIDVIFLLYKHIIDFQNAERQGAKKERKRLARDLHDDVSSKVLSLIYRSVSEENADLGREILAELRNVINELENDELSLTANLFEWQCDARQRCEEAGLRLNWDQSSIHENIYLSSAAKSNLRKIIRESLTNIIKHANATAVNIEINYIKNNLGITIKDDGHGFDMDVVPKGRGLLNIQRRVKEIGATIEWISANPRGSVINMNLPLMVTTAEYSN